MSPLARCMDEAHTSRDLVRPTRLARKSRTGQASRALHQVAELSSPLKTSPSPPTTDRLTVLYWMLAPTEMFCVKASRSDRPSAEPLALRAPSGVLESASPPVPPPPPVVPVVV